MLLFLNLIEKNKQAVKLIFSISRFLKLKLSDIIINLMLKAVKNYFGEVVRELKKVSWPDKKQTINQTFLVIVVSLLVALYIGSLDFAFQQIMKLLVKNS